MTSARASHLGVVLLVVGLIAAMGAGTVFARADQVARMGADAHDLAVVERASSETATHRASLVVAFAALGGTSEAEDVSAAAGEEARLAATRIVELVGSLDHPDSDLATLANQLLIATTEAAALIGAGEIGAARAVVEADALPAVEDVAEGLRSIANELSARIEAERAEAGRLARLASFLVALLLPALTVAGYRRTTRRRAERDRLEAELAQQRKVAEVKDHLIAGISHQLRTPITGIYGYADLLSHRPEPSLIDEGVTAILGQSADLRRMVDDILVTARFDAKAVTYQKVPTDVAALVDRVVGHHRRLGATIEVDVEAVEIATDGGRLEQALRNLVSNAVTHGREPITIVGRPQGDRYQIAVCDGGEGLDERQEGDPFAPFAHAPEDVPTANSLGLGLSVASTLITGLGGSISYARRSGTTVFAISLPGTIEVPTEEPTPSNQGALEAAAH